jgi:phenylacetaldehyde dehydrogenase
VWGDRHALLDIAMPSCGMKQSGFGRELGRATIGPYAESKSVMSNSA